MFFSLTEKDFKSLLEFCFKGHLHLCIAVLTCYMHCCVAKSFILNDTLTQQGKTHVLHHAIVH